MCIRLGVPSSCIKLHLPGVGVDVSGEQGKISPDLVFRVPSLALKRVATRTKGAFVDND